MLKSKINAWVIWVNFFYIFMEKIMFKSHQIKSNHRVVRENGVDTHDNKFLHLIKVPLL